MNLKNQYQDEHEFQKYTGCIEFSDDFVNPLPRQFDERKF